MSRIVVDTAVASYIFNWRSLAQQYAAALRGSELILSFMTIAELRMGAILSTFRNSGCSHSENIAPRKANLVKAHVVKEQRATLSAAPGTESLRPTTESGLPNVILAGDWTRTGWPATMEGAVRSGYLAAEAVAQRAGRPGHFLLPDLT